MQLGSQFSKPTFLEQIDIFGIAIAIRFNTSPSHNTRFGGFITLGILGILFFQLISVLEVLFKQANPQVIQSNDYVYQPEPFQITPKTFNFAIGLQDINFNQFMDETIYVVKGVQQNLIKTKNETTGDYDQKWIIKDIQLVQCTEENFQIEDTQQYFLQQLYQKMYCFNLEEDNATIEGEFSALIYRSIVLHFDECIGNGCATNQTKMNYINQPTLALFMSNNIIQIKDKYKPYQTIGKNLYWVSGPEFNKYVTLNFVNNYINSDFAFYGNKWQKDRVVSLSTSGESVLPRTSNTMFSLTLVYEKNLEINYYRSYLKLDQAFSQLGGLFNGLLAIGFIICKPLSQLELNRKLLNSIFNISKEDQEEIEKDQIHAPTAQQKADSPQQRDQSQSQVLKESQKMKASKSEIKNSTDIINQIKNQANTKKKGEINNDVNNFFKVQFSELQIKFRDYLSYYLRFFKRFQSVKQKIITYGTDKLYSQIDIFYIINKMIELEKLKHLLLNQHQIKLFEYLPRPQLRLQDMIEQENANNDPNEKEKSPQITDFNMSMNSPDIKKNQKAKEKDKFTIFALDDKDPLQKAQDAQRAFNYIQRRAQRGKKSQIDEKLVRMLDPKLVNMFKDNSFDFGTQPINLDEDSDDNEGENDAKKGIDKQSSVLKKSIFQADATFKIDKTILEQEEEEENKDLFNVSNIPIKQDRSQQNQEAINQMDLSQINQKSVLLLTQSQSITPKQSAKQNKSNTNIQKGAQNQGDITDYLDSNNISLTQSPFTTNRQLQDKNQDGIQEKGKNDYSQENHHDQQDIIEDDKRNEGDENGIQVTRPSNARKYFDNSDHHQ
ncbi:transmembrane protein, putative (macronuclear) [Tetrahymena thermophila SB210]|uniref:Transmembrane protein, putative n=1 Tax=Tetrahymena thermophila (strain SB210) TaxID=312017 RepID=Q24E39_TETTS|nr:transmembrane protein, putative [Tetrahymena thermophila SB210]EAS06062.2 transmembrane protein, putative [Tetrahymena thermophila SB210]|eukprot:XP_001026307.2 transmembrane protein, putative [Tetrahymena thermophila SB210]